jgi:subtilisin family serine protease
LFAAHWILFSLCLAQLTGVAQTPSFSQPPASTPPYREDRILIKPKHGVSPAALANFHSARQGEVLQTFEGMGRMQIVRLPKGENVKGFIAKYEQSGLVEFAEPDYTGHIFATTPNDPKFVDGTLWGLKKIGAPDGWDVLTSASNIIVAVIDTGVRYTHEDLASNMWVNPNDGGHGWNAITGTNNPYDGASGFTISHGTLVAGVLGAVGNNVKGVVGVAWQVQIMACQCFDNGSGNGSISDAITCMDYARTNGARIINASWGFSSNSLALSNAVDSLRIAGVILVAACGNSSANIDVSPVYPASYHLDNVVSVACTTSNDTLATFSSYGPTSVQLAAPGDQITSTVSASDSFYGSASGTSMSAPYVAGTFALMLAKYPAETYQQIISRVLNATDPLPSLAGKCVTGGRLNLQKALNPPIILTVVSTNGPFHLHLATGANRTCVIQFSTNFMNWSPIYTNTTSANGTFDFTDSQSTNSTQRFYRATSSL